jgi:hypothetical protein
MPEPALKLVRAELHEMKSDFSANAPNGRKVKVQFNPETLKVTFANQIVQPSGPGDQRGTPSRQFVGAGTTKLSLQLWFDVTALPQDAEAVKDVRRLTQDIAFFITPKEVEAGKTGPQFVPPAVRFLWGSFQFDGMIDSLEESLEFFSPDGRPLRASMNLGLTQQKITKFTFNPTSGDAAGPGAGDGGPRDVAAHACTAGIEHAGARGCAGPRWRLAVHSCGQWHRESAPAGAGSVDRRQRCSPRQIGGSGGSRHQRV